MSRPFRFGVQVSQAASGKAWRDLARKVEDLGFSTIYMPDHLGEQWGPLVGMTIAAEATESLRVGWLVLDNDYRHPVVLAKEIATLDLATEGRVEFGLGAGWMKSDYDESGMAYDEPAVRVDRMEEGLAIMKALWADGRCDFTGEHYRITAALGHPRPHSTPGPEIVIGGGGKRVLSIAAREADIVGINPNLKAGYVGPEVAASSAHDKFKERLGWVKEAAGARFDQLDLQILTFIVQITTDRLGVAKGIAPFFGIEAEDALTVPLALVGTEDEIIETCQQRRDELGFNYIVVHEPELDAFAPIVAALAGT